MQQLVGRARWDADRVRDDVREYVLEHLGDDEDTVLVAGESWSSARHRPGCCRHHSCHGSSGSCCGVGTAAAGADGGINGAGLEAAWFGSQPRR
jgi:hypothetical protein